MKNIIITGPSIHSPQEAIKHGCVVINGAKITDITTKNINSKHIERFDLPENWHIIPGMIDIHVHGASGHDTMDGTSDSFAAISQALAKTGVTSFLATTVTESKERITRALAAARESHCDASQLLGINLEGPFISSKKAGAQNLKYIISPDIELFKQWQNLSGNLIKITTVAPEEPNGLELIKYLKSTGICASFGHSDANYEQALAAIKAGCENVTHLFITMRSLHHREPNALTAMLLDNNIYAEIIADDIHIHPAVLQLALKLKTAEKIILITDAIRAQQMPDGNYELGGQNVIVKNNEARLKDETLAGSVLTMDQALRNIIKFTGCSLDDAIKMTSENPAKLLKIFDRKGSITIGKDADLVVLDENYNIRMTICGGKIVINTVK